MRVRFGDCVFDSETRELVRAERPVRIPPRAFQLLEVLIERRPEAIAKDDLHRVLWPKTFVADTTLTGLVKDLRAAIGDDARTPQFIRTVSAFGYAFCGDARQVRRSAPAGFFCRVIGPESQVGLVEGENIFGRGPDSVLWIDDDTVSRRHARIRVEKDRRGARGSRQPKWNLRGRSPGRCSRRCCATEIGSGSAASRCGFARPGLRRPHAARDPGEAHERTEERPERDAPARLAPRTLRDPVSARRGRDGRGVPGAGYAARTRRGPEDSAEGGRRRFRPLPAVPDGGEGGRGSIPSQHRRRLRHRAGSRYALHRLRARARRHADDTARARPASGQEAARSGDPDCRRPRGRARERHRSPRFEAGQHPPWARTARRKSRTSAWRNTSKPNRRKARAARRCRTTARARA